MTLYNTFDNKKDKLNFNFFPSELLTEEFYLNIYQVDCSSYRKPFIEYLESKYSLKKKWVEIIYHRFISYYYRLPGSPIKKFKKEFIENLEYFCSSVIGIMGRNKAPYLPVVKKTLMYLENMNRNLYLIVDEQTLIEKYDLCYDGCSEAVMVFKKGTLSNTLNHIVLKNDMVIDPFNCHLIKC